MKDLIRSYGKSFEVFKIDSKRSISKHKDHACSLSRFLSFSFLFLLRTSRRIYLLQIYSYDISTELTLKSFMRLIELTTNLFGCLIHACLETSSLSCILSFFSFSASSWLAGQYNQERTYIIIHPHDKPFRINFDYQLDLLSHAWRMHAWDQPF